MRKAEILRKRAELERLEESRQSSQPNQGDFSRHPAAQTGTPSTKNFSGRGSCSEGRAVGNIQSRGTVCRACGEPRANLRYRGRRRSLCDGGIKDGHSWAKSKQFFGKSQPRTGE